MDSAVAPDEQPPTKPRPGGVSGLLRLFVLPIGCVLLIGAVAYTASIALSPDKPVPSAMCLDSSCSFGMSAGSDMSSTGKANGARTPAPARHRSPPERIVRAALHLLHLR